MKAIKITDISQVENIRDRYFIRNCLTNNYLMLDEYENLIREDKNGTKASATYTPTVTPVSW